MLSIFSSIIESKHGVLSPLELIYVINLTLTYSNPTVRLLYIELGNQALK